MLSISLQPQEEYQWLGENPSPDTFPTEKNWYPLYHQWLTYNADAPIIVNTYNTGTGKTKAALLRLLKRARTIGFENLQPSQHNALLIAPTNELLAQHVDDARQFCKENKLPYRVVAVTKKDLDDYQAMPGFSEDPMRGGEVLRSIFNNASKVDKDTSKRATLFVVNPDIFYYAVLFCYNRFDRVGLFNNVFKAFNYIIVDEFHYYNPKQLTAFLFFMKFSQHLGYIDSNATKRQFCILTATPRPQVESYLKNLGVPIAWIAPGDIPQTDLPFVQSVRALAPVQLQVYNTEELQNKEAQRGRGGLLQLVERQRGQIRVWLDAGLDGAIISSSLGTINRIHYELQPVISSDEMGRITGAELRDARAEAKKKSLILATPTVDIGYNFERSKPQRQNIDFLLFDAFSGDELIQRLGRAGRVLAKKERNHPSTVLVVVEPEVELMLRKSYDGQAMERAELGRLAANEMPKRNDLYAYIKVGAMLELFRPITFIGQGTAEEDLPELEAFLGDMQTLFEVGRTFSYKQAKSAVRAFEDRKKWYDKLTTVPEETFETFHLCIEGRLPAHAELPPDVEKCVQALLNRLGEAQKRVKEVRGKGRDAVEWMRRDLRCYFVDKARFSFRDSFQPPLALVYDAGRLHSSKLAALYNALHIIKYYHARFYQTEEEWTEASPEPLPLNAKDAFAYCSLLSLREKPLQLGLRLNANEYTQKEWEERQAYQITTLHGLEVVSLKEDHVLDRNMQLLLHTQFVPAFAAAETGATANEMWRMHQRARFFPLTCEVTFCDAKTQTYLVILGSMAFQVGAEIPYRALVIDGRKTLLADETPLIC